MKIWRLFWLPLAAVLAFPTPVKAAAPGALEGVGLVCSALLEAVSRQPILKADAEEEAYAAIEQILALRGYDFGSGKARALALIRAAYITAFTRTNDADVKEDLREIRDICVDAVLTGRLTLDPL